MTAPSKELLIKVIGYKNPHPLEIEDSKLYLYKEAGENITTINIYELGHKCKDYIIRNNYSLHITHDTGGLDCRVIIYKKSVKEYFHENTELESIFKACEWVLKETK